MKGRIYTDQKCPICGGQFVHDERRSGLFCHEHPDIAANGRFRVRFGREVHKRFQNYAEAERFLTGLRFKFDEGSYDHRDYQKENPLAFDTLVGKWLQLKKKEVKHKSYNNLFNYMRKASSAWGKKNIKTIGYAEIEDFLLGQDVSDKTRANMRSCLHSFWTWLYQRKVITIYELPEFPKIKFKLGYRKIIDKQTQKAIIDEVYRLTYHINPKIWLGIKWLATYISIRPGELVMIKENDLDLNIGCFILGHEYTKEGRDKFVPMLPEDRDLIKSLPRGLPHLPFFRHLPGISGCKSGQPFGKRYFYKWWKRACENLGVDGVDLYGGTRHSTITGLRQFLSPEEIKVGTMHRTNKALDRYLHVQNKDILHVYQVASQTFQAGQQVANMEYHHKQS